MVWFSGMCVGWCLALLFVTAREWLSDRAETRPSECPECECCGADATHECQYTNKTNENVTIDVCDECSLLLVRDWVDGGKTVERWRA